MRTLVIRADAGIAIGTGHVMRCLGLAQCWRDQGGAAIFVMAHSTPALSACLSYEGMKQKTMNVVPGGEMDVTCLIETAREHRAEWIVVDGYQFNENFQFAIKQAGFKLMVVDDTGECGHYFADIVLNQNVTACEDMYSKRESHTRLLLGTDYLMLRRDFEQWYERQRSFPAVGDRILVTMGGSDPNGLTLPLMEAFAEIREYAFRVTVVVGGSNPRIVELQQAAKQIGEQTQLLTDVRDISEIMAQSDLAVLCGGGTLWEALYMGCASLTFSRPGVQEQINEKLSTAGAILDLGSVEDFGHAKLEEALQNLVPSVQRRESMAQRGRELVDGRGVRRVVSALTQPCETTAGGRRQ